jgi:hypothetical protein
MMRDFRSVLGYAFGSALVLVPLVLRVSAGPWLLLAVATLFAALMYEELTGDVL